MNNNAIFKVGRLQNLQSEIQIEELENGCLDFFISSNSESEYSLEFKSIIKKDAFLSLEMGKEINLLNLIDSHDVVVKENGKFNLNCTSDLKINRYLPNSFLLILSARTNDTYLYIETEFKL